MSSFDLQETSGHTPRGLHEGRNSQESPQFEEGGDSSPWSLVEAENHYIKPETI